MANDREKRKAKELLKTIAEFLINEGLLVTDNDEDIRVYYSAIDDLIEECGDNEEEQHITVSKIQTKERFPNRKVIAFTGEDLNIYQRKAIIKELKEDTNTILITTQQSLSCSLNIGFIDHIFITQLQWNDSRMG